MNQILKVAQFNEQWGEGENTFSPRWHEENPYPNHCSANIGGVQEKTAKQAAFVIDYRIDPRTGIRRLVRIPAEEATDVIPDMYVDEETGQIKAGIFLILPEDDIKPDNEDAGQES